MPILTCIFFTFYWLTLTFEIHFVKFHPVVASCFTLQRQKKVCTPGDEAIMKIHEKLFSGIPFNYTIFIISPKLQRIWSWNFGFAIRKIRAFIWYQKNILLPVEPWGMRMWSAQGPLNVNTIFEVFGQFTIRCIRYFSKRCWQLWDRAQKVLIFGSRCSIPLTECTTSLIYLSMRFDQW